jgi:arylsulfatase A-like enzyme
MVALRRYPHPLPPAPCPLLSGETDTHRDTVYAEMGCDRMLRTDRYKLCWGEPSLDTRKLGRLHLDKPVDIPPSPGALYDLAQDPQEERNLIDDPAHRDLRLDLLERLHIRINQNTQTRPFLSRGEYRPLRDRIAAGHMPQLAQETHS